MMNPPRFEMSLDHQIPVLIEKVLYFNLNLKIHYMKVYLQLNINVSFLWHA